MAGGPIWYSVCSMLNVQCLACPNKRKEGAIFSRPFKYYRKTNLAQVRLARQRLNMEIEHEMGD